MDQAGRDPSLMKWLEKQVAVRQLSCAWLIVPRETQPPTHSTWRVALRHHLKRLRRCARELPITCVEAEQCFQHAVKEACSTACPSIAAVEGRSCILFHPMAAVGEGAGAGRKRASRISVGRAWAEKGVCID